jgi:hypothetical protein
MSNKKQEFLEISPSDNIDWAAQQIIYHFNNDQFMELQAYFAKLDEVLYKSWAKEMSFAELKQAVDLVAELSDFQ